MKVLIVYAHMEPQSFNAAMLATAKDAVTSKGGEVMVSDLYAMNFNPVPSAADFKDCDRSQPLDYYAEQKRAYEAGTLADDIQAEIDKIRWCDFLILQFPLYWFSVPAILKGWIDRVFVPGFAFGGGAWYDRGGLAGKRAMLATTMAAYPQMMAADGINGLLDVNLWPLQNGVLAFSGFDVLQPFIANAIPYGDDIKRQELLTAYADRLRGSEHDEPMQFHQRADFDRNWAMKPGVEPRTVGHYFSKVSQESLGGLRSGPSKAD